MQTAKRLYLGTLVFSPSYFLKFILARFFAIQVLFLSKNNIRGTVPGSWANFTVLNMIDLSNNQLSGM